MSSSCLMVVAAAISYKDVFQLPDGGWGCYKLQRCLPAAWWWLGLLSAPKMSSSCLMVVAAAISSKDVFQLPDGGCGCYQLQRCLPVAWWWLLLLSAPKMSSSCLMVVAAAISSKDVFQHALNSIKNMKFIFVALSGNAVALPIFGLITQKQSSYLGSTWLTAF